MWDMGCIAASILFFADCDWIRRMSVKTAEQGETGMIEMFCLAWLPRFYWYISCTHFSS